MILTVMVPRNCQKTFGLIIVAICLVCLETLSAEGLNKSCDTTQLFECGPTESCVQFVNATSTSGECRCQVGLVRSAPDGPCLAANPGAASDSPPVATPAPPSSTHRRLLAAVLVPLLVVLAALVGLVYAGRRYQWVQRLRAMRQRRYDEVQFGQEEDDPPLA